MVPYTACAAPPTPFAPASSTRTTTTVSPQVLRGSDHLDVRAHREELGEDLRLEGQGLRQLLVPPQDHHRTTVGRDVLHDAHQVLEVAVDDADDVVLRERRLRPAGEACSGGRGLGERCAAARRSLCSRRVASLPGQQRVVGCLDAESLEPWSEGVMSSPKRSERTLTRSRISSTVVERLRASRWRRARAAGSDAGHGEGRGRRRTMPSWKLAVFSLPSRRRRPPPAPRRSQRAAPAGAPSAVTSIAALRSTKIASRGTIRTAAWVPSTSTSITWQRSPT